MCLVITCLILVMAPLARTQPLSFHVFAGSTNAGATNGLGSNARFNLPAAIASDAAGNFYVADTENSTIRKIAPNGNASSIAGSPGDFGSADGNGGDARFYGPQGIAAASSGQLYVADSANNTIRQIDLYGDVTTVAGVPGHFNSLDGAGAYAQFYHPEGVAVDPGGNLFVADTWNHTIRLITAFGQVSTLAGLPGNFGSADGTNSKARFNRPTGMAIDAAMNLYVADSLNHTIRKITSAGTVTTIAGLAGVWGSADGTNNSARFYLPQGIGITPGGGLFVADSGNQTVRKLSLVGTDWVVTTVGGSNGIAGFANGNGSAALFNFPTGIALDSFGNVYVADSANNIVRTSRLISPYLKFTKANKQLLLSWPTSADGFILEQTAAFDPAAVWSPATNGIVTVGDNYFRTNSLSGSDYYRLHHP